MVIAQEEAKHVPLRVVTMTVARSMIPTIKNVQAESTRYAQLIGSPFMSRPPSSLTTNAITMWWFPMLFCVIIYLARCP